jgi:hypothetical protein
LSRHAFPPSTLKPLADRFYFRFPTFQHADLRLRAVEYRNGATPFFGIPINVGHFGSQQPVGLRSDLV